MYDTLMQMGRWFGFRPGYADLCRLYTTPELIRWYAHITLANEELMELFDEMVAARQTPETFGLRVRKSPDGLMVTAPAKMRHSKSVRLTFGDSTAETITFRRADVEPNLSATERLIAGLGVGWEPSRTSAGISRPTRLWHHVRPEVIEQFLEDYRTDPDVLKSDSHAIAEFIRASAASGDLVDWTVALISVGDGPGASIGGLGVGLVRRQLLTPGETLAIKRIVSPTDETLDLTMEERARALEATIQSWAGGRREDQAASGSGWMGRQAAADPRARPAPGLPAHDRGPRPRHSRCTRGRLRRELPEHGLRTGDRVRGQRGLLDERVRVGGRTVSLDNRWRDLENSAPGGAGHLRMKLEVTGPVDVYLALAEPSGCRVVALAFPKDVDIAPLRDVRLRGLEISKAPFPIVGDTTTISIATRSTEYNDIFAALAEDVVGAVEAAAPDGVVEATASRLTHWQRFLERTTPDGLSPEAQVGLFGELWFLVEHLRPAVGELPSAEAWQGPLGGLTGFPDGHLGG